MSGWRLDPGAIGVVLTSAEEDLETMNGAWSASQLEGAVEDLGAVGAAGVDVCAAVVEVLNAQGGRLSSMGNRVSAGLMGVESATACYEAGQEGMAAECQSQMLASAGSGDFSWWYGSTPPQGAV